MSKPERGELLKNQTLQESNVITRLEPDILEREVQWALRSIAMNKASGGGEIPVKLFQILKAEAVKMLHSVWMCLVVKVKSDAIKNNTHRNLVS